MSLCVCVHAHVAFRERSLRDTTCGTHTPFPISYFLTLVSRHSVSFISYFLMECLDTVRKWKWKRQTLIRGYNLASTLINRKEDKGLTAGQIVNPRIVFVRTAHSFSWNQPTSKSLVFILFPWDGRLIPKEWNARSAHRFLIFYI